MTSFWLKAGKILIDLKKALSIGVNHKLEVYAEMASYGYDMPHVYILKKCDTKEEAQAYLEEIYQMLAKENNGVILDS